MTSMVAAIYCRKSTEQHVADDQKSIARQLEHARTYAGRKGWAVDDRFVFADDGISGAEFGAKRPGLLRLMNALAPRPPFSILIMSEESRLGRESIEVAYLLKQIIAAGVRVFFYLEDRERTLDSPVEKVMLSIQAMADEMEREKARQRMVDTMSRKAKAGHVTGGRCFGYENVVVYAGVDAQGRPRRSHVEHRVLEPEAAVVRRIFELAASGLGQPAIAKQLNAEGVLAPNSQQGRPRAWVQSSVNAVLWRERYKGVIVWNKTQKRDRWGQRRTRDRGAADWIAVESPHLAIVTPAEWHAAHAAIARSRVRMKVKAPKGRGGRPSKYLLPGLARCGCCRGGIHVRTRQRAGDRLELYACTSHYQRGDSVCGNKLQIPMAKADQGVIEKIQDLLTPAVIQTVIESVKAQLEPDDEPDPRDRIHVELQALERQEAHLTDAIALGGDLPALVTKLQALQQRRQALLAELKTIDTTSRRRIDWAAVEKATYARLADWRATLASRVTTETKSFLKELFAEPLTLTPVKGQRAVRFEAKVQIGGILEGIVEGITPPDFMASPGGLEPPAYRLGGGRSIH